MDIVHAHTFNVGMYAVLCLSCRGISWVKIAEEFTVGIQHVARSRIQKKLFEPFSEILPMIFEN